MPRKRNPILGRAWDLIGSFSIIVAPPMSKMHRPHIARKLQLFKRNDNKYFTPLRSYISREGFIREYQFSTSSTPLPGRNKSRFLCLLCGNSPSFDEARGDDVEEEDLYFADQGQDESVDERAERFIENFYHEMRMQRQDC